MSKNKSNFLWRSERRCYFWHSEHEASESEVTFTFKCQLYSWHLKFIHKTQRKTSSSDLFAKFNFYVKMSRLVSKIPKSKRKEKKFSFFKTSCGSNTFRTVSTWVPCECYVPADRDAADLHPRPALEVTPKSEAATSLWFCFLHKHTPKDFISVLIMHVHTCKKSKTSPAIKSNSSCFYLFWLF